MIYEGKDMGIVIGAFFGLIDSFVEIVSLGLLSTDLRYRWAYYCVVHHVNYPCDSS